eukprot:3418720-Amphidinium_carterae.1
MEVSRCHVCHSCYLRLACSPALEGKSEVDFNIHLLSHSIVPASISDVDLECMDFLSTLVSC